MKKMVMKLQERSPLRYQLVRCAASLSPVNMANHSEEASLKFEKLVDAMHRHNRLEAKEADNANDQYEKFLELEVIPQKNKCKCFDFHNERLDEFLGHYMVGVKNY